MQTREEAMFPLATTMVNWLLYHIGSSEESMKASQDPVVEVNCVPQFICSPVFHNVAVVGDTVFKEVITLK